MLDRKRTSRLSLVPPTWVAVTASLVAIPASAQSLLIPYEGGVVGPQGAVEVSIDPTTTLSTLGIAHTFFYKPEDHTGSEITSGFLRLIPETGSPIDIPGVIDWTIDQDSTPQYWGFTPDPGNTAETISWSGGSYTLSSTRKYALRERGATLFIADGANVVGSAADADFFSHFNAYILDTTGSSMPRITGPAGAAGDIAAVAESDEGSRSVGGYTSSPSAQWELAGQDADDFIIDADTGHLQWSTPPDFEAPADADEDNTYAITVIAQTSSGVSAFQDLRVVVADIEETSPDLSALKTVIPVSLPGHAYDCAVDATMPEADIMTPGICVEYRVEITSADNGSAPAEDLLISDTLPAGLSFVSILEQQGFDDVAIDAFQSVTATRATMPSGSLAFFRIRALID